MSASPESSDRGPQWLEQVLRRAAAGEADAWRALVDAYTGRVFGLIRAQCGNADLAEEITQSTFCTIVAKIGGYTEVGKFEQWLFRIAMNRLRDEMRRRKRQARSVEDEALTALAGPVEPGGAGRSGGGAGRGEAGGGAGGGAGYEPAEFQALRVALTQLSEADQEIVHLRHQAGLSFKQIAEILEQPLGTVLARQHRALKKLGELMAASRRSGEASGGPGEKE